ncbi:MULTISPECIES: CrcB family protein [unclassified Wenzhouxiangella]|uniref:fluoride efflux transporter FluC n=1 Tax=unclassified Wenzhouxiangella TaxID=2613841 RepID=UPI000E32C766|nr:MULTISPECIES: CrcB family protein [unclassified Wenzhouxiangella]RFF28699.1 CrcB family protein [Wenzhouxiangella sp. 15181]RFP70244.1 CrcB family protein [Wenzhouxiangella sp. 15190]
MVEIVLVALGSALGALSRFALGQWFLRIDSRFPLLATLGVNLSGCGLAGLFAGSAWQSHELLAGFLATGFLGSYTTVSSFSLETLGLWQSGRRGRAAVYVLLSMLGGLLLAWAGWLLAARMVGLS